MAGDGFIKSLMLEIPLDRNMFIEYGPGAVSTRAAVPFYPRTEWAVAPDGGRVGVLTIAFSGPEAETFRVTIYEAPSSREIFSRTVPYQGIPIPDHVVDSVLEARARAIAAAPPLPFGRTRPTLSRGEERELRSRMGPFTPRLERSRWGWTEGSGSDSSNRTNWRNGWS